MLSLRMYGFTSHSKIDCKAVVFFANAGDRQYANERRSGASVKTARENGRVNLVRFTSEDHAYGASFCFTTI